MKRSLLQLVSLLILLGPANGQAPFSDMAADLSMNQMGRNYGVSVADFNNDGWDDIFAIRQIDPCQLYQNNGDGTFTEVSAAAGVDFSGSAVGAAWADIDNDGWLDLLVTSREGDNRLYHSNGDGTFTDIAASAGVLEGTKVKSTLFADVDMDGFIDIYLARLGMENILYRNNGDLTFSNFTNQSNAKDNQISMGAMFFDYDNDGDPDLYLTHDANQPFILYRNLGNGTFQNVSVVSGANIAAMGMGVDFGDVNNDGWLDIYVTNLSYNALLINNGSTGPFGPGFTNVAQAANVADPGMGWGISFLDFDNDGLQDIYVANDSYFTPLPNLLYRNLGDPNGTGTTFEVVSEGTPLASMEGAYGFGCTDYNNDGLVDIYLANWMGPIGNQFFRNEVENDHNWVKIKGFGTVSNWAAIGAKVTLEAGGIIHTDEISGGSGYSSQNSLTLHFGLGVAEIIDKLTIRWPNGLVEEYEALPVNTTYSFTEGEGFVTPAREVLENEMPLAASPNPFGQQLQVRMDLPAANPVSLTLHDQLGRTVQRLNLGHLPAGHHSVTWEIGELPAGLYHLRMQAGQLTVGQKLLKL